jgi:7-carboxy-7-deazaguanine synthase
MKIAELFYSIQGEGVLLGVPSVFIRVSGCNLRCTWCDTPYTSWNPEGGEMPLDRIMDYVREYSQGHVVLTGGEPMIMPETPELSRLLHQSGQHITIETAGAVDAPVACDLMSISPKLANSTPLERDGGRWAHMHERARYRPEVIRRLMSVCEYQLKFVVSSPADLDEIHAIVAEVGADRHNVVLMPEGAGAAALAARSEWLTEVAKREGYRFTPRLHVLLYGNRRGT